LNLEPGTQLGPYRILAALGAGGMGEVYRARDTKLDRDIALKILPPDVASVDTLRRFEKEARAASALNHANIVAIYDVGRHGAIAYIAMELVEGQTLRAAMAEPLPLKEALRIAAKVADVLASAHERGVTHRDLKPENVMISRDGYIKLVDIGLAKVHSTINSGDKTKPQTTAGHVFGTTSYMSPEQASARPIDFRSDQFSLAVMLYEMIMGKRPFDRTTGVETLTAIIRDEPPPIVLADDSLRLDIQHILKRCLEKEPGNRYASTRDLAHDLRELRNRLTLGSHSGRALRTSTLTAPRLPVMAGVVVALLIAVVGLMALQRQKTSNNPQNAVQGLAVLPFTDVSATRDGQTFTDGISEMISARIAQAHDLRVIAPFDDAKRRQGASHLLKGSVQRAGDQLRVKYDVIEASSGNRIAGDVITAPGTEIFTLEDYVADGVLKALSRSRSRRAPRATATLAGADQQTYTEAVGLLQRIDDVTSIDRAIESLQSLLRNSRDAANVNGTLGRALLRKYVVTRNRALVDEAAIYAERAAQLDPDEPEAQITLGELRRISGRHAEAVASYQRALILQPNAVYAQIGLGDTYALMGRAADAEQAYKQALRLAPDLADVYGHYGAFCYAQGRHADAARYFTKQCELLPNAPRAFANLGAAEQALGHYELALKAFERSVAMKATSGGLSNLGTCQYFLGRFGDAASSYEKATALAPNNFLIWANLGDAYRATQEPKTKTNEAYAHAIRLARDAIAVNQHDALARAVSASSLAKSGDIENAAAQVRLALEAEPTNADVLYHAAVVSRVRGNDDAAIGWLQRAVSSGYSATAIARDPEFTSLHNDSRFKAIAR
jgi:serine/threonine-protein kinase